MLINELFNSSSEPVIEGAFANPDQPDSAVASAIIRRILLQRTDLLSKYGPEKVGQAVDDVADFVGDTDEIGSSDVSGWVRQVEQTLGNMQEGVAEADINAVDINQVASQMKFLPTTKQAKQYKFVKDGVPGQMLPMTYTVSAQEQPVVTVTSDGKETQNIAAPNDIIMSGPSKENYVVKAAKFPKLYQGNAGGTVVPEQSPRLVALYTGNTPITFTAPWGESMILKPGDYLVKDGDAGYYRVAKVEYKQTYNEPGQKGVAEAGPVTIGSKIPKSDTETFGLEPGRPYKINDPKDWKKGDRPRAIQQLIPTQDKKDHIRSRLGQHRAPVLPEQGVAEGDISQLEKDVADAPVEPIANMEAQEKIGGRHDADDFDSMVLRMKKLAGAGPMKTVWDPARRVYRNMPTAVQPAQQPKK